MKRNGDPHEEFEKAFSKRHAGYVLITCEPPSDSGEMNIAMTYGGSISLATMLIDGAQSYLVDEPDAEECDAS